MLLLEALPITRPLDDALHEPSGGGEEGWDWSPEEEGLLALTLIATWAARTGRALRDAPVDELSAAELEAFWADDQLEPPYSAPTRRRSW